jgi:signal transduction histidine kinase
LREVEAMNEELRRVDKVKSDFIQRVAHELRTPITIIYGYSRLIQTSEMIKPAMVANPEFRAYVDGLVESIERMHALVNEILTIYRIVTGEVEAKLSTINTASLVKNILSDFEKAIQQRRMQIKFDDVPDGLTVPSTGYRGRARSTAGRLVTWGSIRYERPCPRSPP